MFLSPSTGILLNDNMGDFAYENIANLYEVEPSKVEVILAKSDNESSAND